MDYNKKYLKYKLKYYQLKNQIGGMNPSSAPTQTNLLPPELLQMISEKGAISIGRMARARNTVGQNQDFKDSIDRYLDSVMDEPHTSTSDLLIIYSESHNNTTLQNKSLQLFNARTNAGIGLPISELATIYSLATPLARNELLQFINDAYNLKFSQLPSYNQGLSPDEKIKHLRILFACEQLLQNQQGRRYNLEVTFGQPPNQTVFTYSSGIYNRINKQRFSGIPDEYNSEIGGRSFTVNNLFDVLLADINSSAQPLTSIQILYRSIFNPSTPHILFNFTF
jgi:hypothetical protein